jgi:pilus assembly protein CpaF
MELDKYLGKLFQQRSIGRTLETPSCPDGSEPVAVVRSPLAAGRSEALQPEAPLAPPDDEETARVRQVKKQIHTAVLQALKPEELSRLEDDRRRPELRTVLEKLLDTGNYPLDIQQRHQVIEELLDDMLGFGPLEPLLKDPCVGDILINGTWSMYVEYSGVLREVPNPFAHVEYLTEIARRIATRVGRQVNESTPMVDARLPDGSRVHVVLPPVALNGPLVSIRRFGAKPLRIPDLLVLQSLSAEMAVFLEAAVRARLNIIVCGGTGSGKTTLLNALSAVIPARERIVTIEDAAELQLQQRHVCRLEARPPNIDGKGAIPIRELVRNTLRMRPDRIIVGECRGAESLDMLQAMNTGHDGSLTTLHANNPREALLRLETLVLLAGVELPLMAIRQQIAAAIHLIIQIERLSGGARRVTRVTEIVGMERDIITTQDLFVFTQTGVDSSGKALGRFEATGVVSHFESRLRAAGVALPRDLFAQRVLLEI